MEELIKVLNSINETLKEIANKLPNKQKDILLENKKGEKLNETNN